MSGAVLGPTIYTCGMLQSLPLTQMRKTDKRIITFSKYYNISMNNVQWEQRSKQLQTYVEILWVWFQTPAREQVPQYGESCNTASRDLFTGGGFCLQLVKNVTSV